MTTTKIQPATNKAKNWLSQKQRVFKSLFQRPQTRLMVSNNTNTPLQNVCRYVADFRKDRAVYVVKVDRCPISEMKAEFISTNPVYAGGQLRMF